jgi:hypothetical protein
LCPVRREAINKQRECLRSGNESALKKIPFGGKVHLKLRAVGSKQMREFVGGGGCSFQIRAPDGYWSGFNSTNSSGRYSKCMVSK